MTPPKNIGRCEVHLGQFLVFFLREIDGAPEVRNRQPLRQPHCIVESVTRERRECRNRLDRDIKVRRIGLHTDAPIPHSRRRRNRRTGPQ